MDPEIRNAGSSEPMCCNAAQAPERRTALQRLKDNKLHLLERLRKLDEAIIKIESDPNFDRLLDVYENAGW